MSFYIRKSIKVGPVRFNLSKSGIGVSGGTKGFRIGTGPRGNFIHLGLGGIYYRKTFPLTAPALTPSHTQHVPSLPWMPSESTSPHQVEMREIESADVSNMCPSSSAELLQELNEKKKIHSIGPWALGASVIIIALCLKASWHPALLVIIIAALAVGVFFAFRRDALKKTTVLLYDFDPTLEQAFENLHVRASVLAQCSGCWHIGASGKVHDKKYHAGASELVSRATTRIRMESPSFLKTNVQTVSIKVGRQVLYFFPDRILVFDSGRIGAVAYGELEIRISPTRFIENSAPRDAQVVDRTWRYVNKKGGPDRRFSNNPQLPVCLYDEVHFFSRSGLNEVIQISRCGPGSAFDQAVRYLAQYTKPVPV